jgi:hypothetical protein
MLTWIGDRFSPFTHCRPFSILSSPLVPLIYIYIYIHIIRKIYYTLYCYYNACSPEEPTGTACTCHLDPVFEVSAMYKDKGTGTV